MTPDTPRLSPPLKPCVCGAHPRPAANSIGQPGTIGYDRWHAIRCGGCGLTLGEADRRFRIPREAVDAWNRLMPTA